MKTAIIGSGIAGLGAAYLLHPRHDITVYEKNALPGGHSRTIELDLGGGRFPVDTGFIVFNRRTYPELCALFERLQVPVDASDMSFGASIGEGWLEYGSKAMFGQRRNLLRPAYWRLLADLLRFNRQALRYLDDSRPLSLGACLDELRMGDWFRRYYLQPLGAAIWSCPLSAMLEFPARSFLRFFHNHGLLSVRDHPQWYTVSGGSREYLRRLSAGFERRIRLSCGVSKVEGRNGRQWVHDSRGGVAAYDAVVLACHADEALALLADASPEEREVLGAFGYQHNRVVVHGDESFMPHRRACWASWSYLCKDREDRGGAVSLTYWMNNLQDLPTTSPVLVSLNPAREPRPGSVYDEHGFKHPVFTQAAIAAQARVPALQGKAGRWYCGAWQRYGFHEDGLWSALRVAESMGVPPPWKDGA